jgi:LuxR family maltose regulon positive regulatory protein
MSETWLETKLLQPRTRTQAVARPRLDQLLFRGSNLKLTLVSAPAGFGKTTLLGSWLGIDDRAGRRTAWVSLDERDLDATSFWTYLLLAVDRAAPGSAAVALSLLQAGQAPIESVLAALLNELSVLPDDLTLVLDDYHRCDGAGIQQGMTFLLDHLPPQVHVVIGTRADPALPLGRPPLHCGGGVRLPQRRPRSRPGCRRCRRPRDPHGGMGRRAPVGGAVAPGPRRPGPVHRRVRR